MIRLMHNCSFDDLEEVAVAEGGDGGLVELEREKRSPIFGLLGRLFGGKKRGGRRRKKGGG